MEIIKSLERSKELIYQNNPSAIIVVDSRNPTVGLDSLDDMHRGLGMKMFGYHYFIDKLGNIYQGRPESAFSCDVELLMQSMYSSLINEDISPFELTNIELTDAKKVQSAGRIFICIEGNTEISTMTPSQRSSLVALGKDIKSRNRNIRNVYSFSEIYPQYQNLGSYVDMNSIRAEVNATIVPVYIDTPAGTVSYSFGRRDFYYNPDNLISGNDIKLLQLYFKIIGIPVKNTNGIYDLFMYQSVVNFQKSYSLDNDGMFNSDDFNTVLNAVKLYNTDIDNSIYRRMLYYRADNMMKGEDIDRVVDKLFQLRLITQIHLTFNESVMNAVKVFQLSNNITNDGVIGPNTWRILEDSQIIIFERNLQLKTPNMQGNDVLVVQEAIKKMARSYGIVTFSMDGVYDEITYNNIRKIQSMINFPINGIVDENMFDFMSAYLISISAK